MIYLNVRTNQPKLPHVIDSRERETVREAKKALNKKNCSISLIDHQQLLEINFILNENKKKKTFYSFSLQLHFASVINYPWSRRKKKSIMRL